MKRKIYILVLILIPFLMTGCLESSALDDIEVTTTVYPIEYLMNELYGYNSTVSSIYPNDVDTTTYELSNKQIKEYSKKTDLFVYTGLTSEKEIAKTFLSKNKRLNIIDATYGIKYSYGLEELWLSPNNYLTLANTIKNDLEELTDNKYTNETIDKNFDELQNNLSLLDAELRSIGKAAKKNGTNTVVVAYPALGFLADYGFNVVDVSSESNVTRSIKNKFKDGTYKYIFVSDEITVTDYIKDIQDNYDVKLIKVNVMNTLTDEERSNGDDYINIMNEFMDTLSNNVLK